MATLCKERKVYKYKRSSFMVPLQKRLLMTKVESIDIYFQMTKEEREKIFADIKQALVPLTLEELQDFQAQNASNIPFELQAYVQLLYAEKLRANSSQLKRTKAASNPYLKASMAKKEEGKYIPTRQRGQLGGSKQYLFGAGDFETITDANGDFRVIIAGAAFDTRSNNKTLGQKKVVAIKHDNVLVEQLSEGLLSDLNEEVFSNPDSIQGKIFKKKYGLNNPIILKQLKENPFQVEEAKGTKGLERLSDLLILDFIKDLELVAQEMQAQEAFELNSKAVGVRFKEADTQGKGVKKKVKKRKVIVYFHNLAAFDGYLILGALARNPGVFQATLEVGGRKFTMPKLPTTLIRDTKVYEIELDNIIFRDSLLLMPASLDALSRTILGLPKGNIDFNALNKGSYGHLREKLVQYLIRDVFLLLACLIKFRRISLLMVKAPSVVEERALYQVDITDALTLPALSFRYFRYYYLAENAKIHISTNDKALDNFLNSSYIGGVSDLYKPVASQGVYTYDINSSYPAVMQKKLMPLGEPRLLTKEDLKAESFNFENFFGFIEATVDVPQDSYFPPLHIRHKEHDIFSPVGVFRGHFFSEELKYALNHGVKIVSLHKAYDYPDTLNTSNPQLPKIFRTYMERLYQIKLGKKKTLDRYITPEAAKMFSKLFMNSLYGRFALRNDNYQKKILTEGDLKILKETSLLGNYYPIEDTGLFVAQLNLGDLNNTLYENEDVIEKEKAFQAFFQDKLFWRRFYIARQVSAAITAYGRMAIHEIKTQLAEEGYTVYYADTDAIHVDKPLPKNHPLLGPKIGQLKHEGSYQEGIYLAPKAYALKAKNGEEKIICPGFDVEKDGQITFAHFQVEYKKQCFVFEESPKTFIKVTQKRPFNRDMASMKITSQVLEKHISFDLRKRKKVFNEDGGDKWIETAPYTFAEIAKLSPESTTVFNDKDWVQHATEFALPLNRMLPFLSRVITEYEKRKALDTLKLYQLQVSIPAASLPEGSFFSSNPDPLTFSEDLDPQMRAFSALHQTLVYGYGVAAKGNAQFIVKVCKKKGRAYKPLIFPNRNLNLFQQIATKYGMEILQPAYQTPADFTDPQYFPKLRELLSHYARQTFTDTLKKIQTPILRKLESTYASLYTFFHKW